MHWVVEKFSLLVETATEMTCACKINIYKHARVVHEPPQPLVKRAWYNYIICMQLIAFFCLFLFDIFWKRLHENLFCSSPTLSQFPGRKRLIGSNVRPISVSVPLFPCVNALSSKNTASLCIYCVRRWVLSFFLSPFYGYRNRVCSCRFSRSMSGIGVGPSESERAGEQNERKHVWEGLFVQIFLKRQMPARVEKNLWLCASVRGRSKYECVPNGHHKDIYCISRSLWSLLFIVFYQP